MRRAKISDSFDTIDDLSLESLKEIVNSKYDEIVFEKQWEWRSNVRSLVSTPKYTTGTASVINGQRQVILSAAATVTEDFKNRYFRAAGDAEYYEIISVSDVTNRTLELATTYKGTTNATSSYTIWKNKYGLYPDFVDIYDVTAQGAVGSFNSPPLEDVTPTEMSQLMATWPFMETTAPLQYTIEGQQGYDSGPPMGSNFIMGYDFMGGTDYPSRTLEFYPPIFNQTVLNIKYGFLINPLVNDDDEPVIPVEERGILVKGGLADWFSLQRIETSQRLWDMKYQEQLNKMKAAKDKTEGTAVLVARRPRRDRLPIFRRSFTFPD